MGKESHVMRLVTPFMALPSIVMGRPSGTVMLQGEPTNHTFRIRGLRARVRSVPPNWIPTEQDSEVLDVVRDRIEQLGFERPPFINGERAIETVHRWIDRHRGDATIERLLEAVTPIPSLPVWHAITNTHRAAAQSSLLLDTMSFGQEQVLFNPTLGIPIALVMSAPASCGFDNISVPPRTVPSVYLRDTATRYDDYELEIALLGELGAEEEDVKL